MSYNFSLSAQVGKWAVHIDPEAAYGYFEHDVYGEGGGLWFEGKELSDYDGVGVLALGVIEAIRSLGFVVSEEFV